MQIQSNQIVTRGKKHSSSKKCWEAEESYFRDNSFEPLCNIKDAFLMASCIDIRLFKSIQALHENLRKKLILNSLVFPLPK